MRTVARDFPDVVGAISDGAVRALFSQRFLVATEIYDELVDAACLRIFEEVAREFSAEEELSPRTRPAFHYMVEKLIHAGFLGKVNEGGKPSASLAAAPLAAGGPSVESLAAELAATEPDAAVGAEIVTLLAAEATEFFRGKKTGEEILFSPARLPLWIRYFSNANILYAINNTLGAEALARVLPSAGAEDDLLAQGIPAGQENLALRETKVTSWFQIGNKTTRLYDVCMALSRLPLRLRKRQTHHPMSAAAATIAIANRAWLCITLPKKPTISGPKRI